MGIFKTEGKIHPDSKKGIYKFEKEGAANPDLAWLEYLANQYLTGKIDLQTYRTLSEGVGEFSFMGLFRALINL